MLYPQNLKNTVVYIEALIGEKLQGGTGVVLNCFSEHNKCHNNIIATCLHVITCNEHVASQVRIWPYNTSYESRGIDADVHPARLKIKGDASDLVLLEISQPLEETITQYTELEYDDHIRIYGYPLGSTRIKAFGSCEVRPAYFTAHITRVTPDIYTCMGELGVTGVSGAPVFHHNGTLVGIYRGRWAPDLSFQEGVIIRSKHLRDLCMRAGYRFDQVPRSPHSAQLPELVPGIPDEINLRLRSILLETDYFGDFAQLLTLFNDTLRPFRRSLPRANNEQFQVDQTIAYLVDKRRTDGRYALILLLQALYQRVDPANVLHQQLVNICQEVEAYKTSP